MDVKHILEAKMRREASEIVFESEIAASTAGVAVTDILRRMNKEVKNKYIDIIIKRLDKGQHKSDAYKEITDTEMLTVLRSAEARSISASAIFSDYKPVKEEIDKADGKLKGALLEPMITYVLLALVGWFVLDGLQEQFKMFTKGAMKLDVSMLMTLHRWFLPAVILPPALILLAIFKYPSKIPMWKKIYAYIKSTRYLLVIKIMYNVGLGSTAAISFLKTVDDKKMKLKLRKLRADEQDMRGITKAMSHYLSPLEKALLQLGMDLSEPEESIESVVKKRILEIDKTSTKFSTGFSKLLLLLSVIPIGFLMGGIMSVLVAVSTMSSGH